MKTIAFLIGNGESRKDIDLNKLKGKGTIIGCNALYRDFTPDVLVAIDPPMIQEIINTGYSINHYFIIPLKRSRIYEKEKKVYGLLMDRCTTSGGMAIEYAGKVKIDTAYLLGYDCGGTNMYLETVNYPKLGDSHKQQYGRAVNLFETSFKQFPLTTYINVIKDKRDGIASFARLSRSYKNYKTIDINEFSENISEFSNQKAVYYHEI